VQLVSLTVASIYQCDEQEVASSGQPRREKKERIGLSCRSIRFPSNVFCSQSHFPEFFVSSRTDNLGQRWRNFLLRPAQAANIAMQFPMRNYEVNGRSRPLFRMFGRNVSRVQRNRCAGRDLEDAPHLYRWERVFRGTRSREAGSTMKCGGLNRALNRVIELARISVSGAHWTNRDQRSLAAAPTVCTRNRGETGKSPC